MVENELAEDAVEGSEPVDVERVCGDRLDACDAVGAAGRGQRRDGDLAPVDGDDVGAARREEDAVVARPAAEIEDARVGQVTEVCERVPSARVVGRRTATTSRPR